MGHDDCIVLNATLFSLCECVICGVCVGGGGGGEGE